MKALRIAAGILVLVVVGMLLGGCGSNEEPTSSGDDSQSQAAEPSVSSTVITLEPSSDPTTQSPDLYSADAPDLPGGDADQIAVVATGDYDGTSLRVIVRNNTGDNVARVAVTAEARDASGGLVAAGESQGFIPNVVEPGELAIGYLYFSGAHLPDNAEITIQVTSDESLAEFENIVGLSIAEANGTQRSIVGLVENPYDIGATGPIDVEAVCFSQDGQLTVGYSAFAVKDALAPADTSPFQIDVFGAPCERFLIGANGFTDTSATTATSASTAPSPTPTPEPSMDVGWTTEHEEAAAQIYADGIKKSHALALRLEVGHCVVDKVQKKMWPTYDEWVATRTKSGLTSDQDKFLDEVGILGTCEFRVGI